MSSRYPVLILIVVLFLVGCANRADSTPALQGAFVPTRVTLTPTHTATLTETPTMTASPTLTEMATETATAAPTETLTETPTESPTATETASPQPTETLTSEPDEPTAAPTSALPQVTQPPRTSGFEDLKRLPIAYGDTVQGEIAGQPVLYRFSGQAGDMVNILMTRIDGDLDTSLQLINAAGEVVGENDDIAPRRDSNSHIRNLVLPADGDYTIVAWRFQRMAGRTTGRFELSLQIGEERADIVELPVISYGQTVTGEVNDETPVIVYVFEASEGDVIDMRLNSAENSNLDPFLVLEDASGSELAVNDDIQVRQNRNSYIREFVIPTTGQYRAVATRFNRAKGDSEGAFEMSLELVGGTQAPTPVPMNAIEFDGPLRRNEFIRGFVEEDKRFYRYNLEVDRETRLSLSVSVEAAGLDPLVSIIAPDGREIARTDKIVARRSESAILDNILLSEPGTYTLLISHSLRRPNMITSGSFEMLLYDSTGENTVIASVVQPITFEQTVTVKLDNRLNDQEIYGFYANAGETIEVDFNIVGGNLVMAYAITDPLTSTPLLYAQDPSSVVIPADGFYSLSFWQRRGSGEAAVTLNKR